jgi:hypothetical protein
MAADVSAAVALTYWHFSDSLIDTLSEAAIRYSKPPGNFPILGGRN